MTNTLRNSQLFLKNKWKAPLVESVSLESSVMNVNKLGLNSLKITKKKSVPRDMLQILHDYLDKSKPKQKSLLDDVKACIESSDPADTPPMHALIRAILVVAMEESDNEEETKDFDKKLHEAMMNLGVFIPLLAKIMQDKSDQIEAMRGIQAFFGSEPETNLPILSKAVRCFYEFGVLSDEAIFEWYDVESKKQNDETKEKDSDISIVDAKVLRTVKPFVRWLETPDEHEEDES